MNANLVHKWRRELHSPSRSAASFVPVAVAAPAVVNEAAQPIELEFHRGALSVRVRWPMADGRRCGLRRLVAGGPSLIRVEAVWLAVEPLDMRAGTEASLARVVSVFGTARPHHD